ncbi:MAG: hypothetical protein AAF802_01150 [Planctomycetota bacterium]
MFRFRLRTLLLCTFVVAAWLPVIYLGEERKEVEQSLSLLRQMSSELSVVDDEKLCIRQLPWVWQSIRSWKYYLPESEDMEVRFATEGINNLGAPEHFHSASLPVGTHTLSLQTTTKNGNRRFVVYIDSEVVIDITHPPDWIESNSSSSSNLVNSLSTAYPANEPLEILTGWFSESMGNVSLGSVPDECDSKGFRLWLAPGGYKESIAPVFIGSTNGVLSNNWGLRNGARIEFEPVRYPGSNGLIPMVIPSEPKLANTLTISDRLQSVSVRPVVDGKPLLPEKLVSTPAEPSVRILYNSAVQKRIENATERLKLTAKYKDFPGGLKVEVDLFFDRRSPNRVGFLPRLKNENAKVEGWELVTTCDQSFYLHQIGLDQRQLEVSSIDPADLDQSGWYQVPLDQLPIGENHGEFAERVLSMHTTVIDYKKVGQKRPAKNNYGGQPIEQRWIVPEQKDIGLFIQKQSKPTQPTVFLDATKVTLPADPDEPVWLQIEPRDYLR